jgi:RNA methyltransferase, TrmH family
MPEIIRSLQNPRIKQAIQLRDAKKRRETGLMVIDGKREIAQALRGGIEIKEVFVREQELSSQNEHSLLAIRLADDELTSKKLVDEPDSSSSARTISRPLNVTYVSETVMAKLAYGERNVLCVAIAKQPSLSLENLELRLNRSMDTGLVLVVDRVEKPGNLGAMLRTADAVGVTAVLLSDPICEVWNPNAIRSSLGAIFQIPIVAASSNAIVSWLRDENFQMLAARLQASKDYQQMDLQKKVAIIVGSEAEGLGPFWLQDDIQGIRLPMQGSVDSLNVSVSAAVLLYDTATKIDWFAASVSPKVENKLSIDSGK